MQTVKVYYKKNPELGLVLINSIDFVDELHSYFPQDAPPQDAPPQQNPEPKETLPDFPLTTARERISVATSLEELDALEKQELAGRGRQGALNAIEKRRKELTDGRTEA